MNGNISQVITKEIIKHKSISIFDNCLEYMKKIDEKNTLPALILENEELKKDKMGEILIDLYKKFNLDRIKIIEYKSNKEIDKKDLDRIKKNIKDKKKYQKYQEEFNVKNNQLIDELKIKIKNENDRKVLKLKELDEKIKSQKNEIISIPKNELENDLYKDDPVVIEKIDHVESYLNKKGGKFKNLWQKRYFIIENDCLNYYTDSSLLKIKGFKFIFNNKKK
jgi:hypothetical protein